MISVVMATYNGEKYIIEQLDSIREQSLSPDEVIICDDRSSDDTINIVSQYIDKYSLRNWHFYINEENLGYGNNFHQAVNKASGDFIFFSDQDDIWALDKIEKMNSIMINNEDCVLLCTDYEPYASDGDAPTPPKQIIDRMPNDKSLVKISMTKKSIYIGALGCCMCVRKSFYDSIEQYWFDSWAQDDRMWRLAQCVDGCYVWHTNDLVKHRLHGNNTSTYGKYHTIEKRVKLFYEMKMAEEQMLHMLHDNSANDIYKKIVVKHIKMMKYRIDMLENGHLMRCVPLVAYLGYYEKTKSYLLEPYLTIREH